ncbi:MAG: hypothetical protein HY235_11400 [Acidobacteria bacterium]|nr:hypothetical protein [Acidobacteriota bacterium]
MTAQEVYELTTRGGATEFSRVLEVCQAFGPYCLIGGLAVNCYVEPVYTLDADIVLVASGIEAVSEALRAEGRSELRVQLTTDPRYQVFLDRAETRQVLGVPVRVACLEDVAQGKLWAYGAPERRLSKRKKDELDLIRLGEAYPQLLRIYPDDLRRQLDST